MENFENFEIHRVGSNILPSFVHPCTKRDLGCHGSTLCGQNLMKMEEISRRRHHPLSPPFERSSNRSVRERERNRRRRLSSLIPSTDPIRIKIEEGCWNGRYYGNFYRRGWWRWFRIEVIFLQELSVLSFRYDKCCRGEAVLTYPFVERNRKGGRNCGICFFLVRSFQSIYAKFNSI